MSQVIYRVAFAIHDVAKTIDRPRVTDLHKHVICGYWLEYSTAYFGIFFRVSHRNKLE